MVPRRYNVRQKITTFETIESISIIVVKKNGGTHAAADPALRKALVEELADVLMYFNDVLLCYGISEEELKKSYTDKFERNMKRW